MKQSEIIEMSVEDIREKIEDVEVAQQNLLLTHSVSQLENPLVLKENRKTIARLKTELRKREIESGSTAKAAPAVEKVEEPKAEAVEETENTESAE